ncbi:hypothetical protein PIB30_089732, partial [Stylosanthes scabra]|nr:hypothetical protein [Stylosanthes scabra]
MALAWSSSPHTLATPWQPRQPHVGTWLPPAPIPSSHPSPNKPPSRHNVILASPCTLLTAPTPRHSMAVA